MAPESERAKKIAWPQESILSRQCFDVECAKCDNKNRDGKPCEHYCHATLTCSEVVERLATEAHEDYLVPASSGRCKYDMRCCDGFNRDKATAILDSWRERRVQELENLLAKRSGCSHCNDSASGSTSANDSSEIRRTK